MFRIYLTPFPWMEFNRLISLFLRTDMYLEKFLPYEIVIFFFPSESYSASRLQVFLLFRSTDTFKTLVDLKLRFIFWRQDFFYIALNLLVCSLSCELQSGVGKRRRQNLYHLKTSQWTRILWIPNYPDHLLTLH